MTALSPCSWKSERRRGKAALKAFITGTGTVTASRAVRDTATAAAAGRLAWIDNDVTSWISPTSETSPPRRRSDADPGILHLGPWRPWVPDVSRARSVLLAVASPVAGILDLAWRLPQAAAQLVDRDHGRDRGYDITSARADLDYQPSGPSRRTGRPACVRGVAVASPRLRFSEIEQVVLGLRWFRDDRHIAALTRDNVLSRATGCR